MSESDRPHNGHAGLEHAGLGQLSLPLGVAPCGFRGRVDAIEVRGHSGGLPPAEIENRLLELGFVEGAIVEILHEGAIARDPIAVRVNNATIALRRREAMAIIAVAEPA